MAAADLDKYTDQAFACLIEGVRNRMVQSSASNDPNEREWIRQDINFMQLSHEALSQRIHHHIARRSRRLNTHAPIHRLPNELLVKIFALTLEANSQHYLSNPRSLIGLGLVSKDWSRMIYDVPSFWAQINSAYSEGENRAAVLRSKEYPLHVQYTDDDFDGRDVSEVVFLDLAIREAYRWRSAEFTLSSDYTITLLHHLVSLSVPSLEELKIDCTEVDEDPSMEGSINIFSGGADRLRHVDLSNVPIPWNSQIISHLETLKISGWSTIHPGPSTREIIVILRRCPKLRTFELHYLGDEELLHDSDSTLSLMEVVHLPFLTSFTLELDNPEAFSQIISSVRIPACTSFNLHCDNPISDILLNNSHLTAVLLSTIRSVPEISLKLKGSTLALNNWSIDITLSHNSPSENLAWLMKHTAGSVRWPPIDANITCDDSLPFPRVADLLHTMSSTTKLTLRGNSDEYITLLSHPTLNNGIHEWVLPNLRELSLEDCLQNSLQLLRDLPRRRKEGADIDRGDGVLLGLPAKLNVIHPLRTMFHPPRTIFNLPIPISHPPTSIGGGLLDMTTSNNMYNFSMGASFDNSMSLINDYEMGRASRDEPLTLQDSAFDIMSWVNDTA
ncbi:hypothetical protein FRB94_011585 [Tulasnella sp. JGI-2019a]|nr:hypothetical protein FRB94_011585 [Tulasnella sp. JGI-2019a]KAG9024746.1 hypothetical protein FRB95_011138 [Tulasnella sp. JGI-2019a]